MIRRAVPADAPALRALQGHLRDPSPDLLAAGLDLGWVLVSTADGRPVGYLLAVRGSDGDGGTHVAELAVAPAHRREGRAAALLERAVADVEGRVTLAVAPENEAARALYRDCGFEVVERRPEYYDDGPALLLARD